MAHGGQEIVLGPAGRLGFGDREEKLLVGADQLYGALGDATLKVVVGAAQGLVGLAHLFLGPLAVRLNAHPRQGHGEIHGLGDVVVRAQAQGVDDVAAVCLAGDHDHRQGVLRIVFTDAAQHLQTIQVRHHHVEQHHVERLAFDHLQGALAAIRLRALEPLALEAAAEDHPVVGDIVDDQDARGLISKPVWEFGQCDQLHQRTLLLRALWRRDG